MISIRISQLTLLAGLGVAVGFMSFAAVDADAAGCSASDIRRATTSNRIYLSGGATCTLSEIALAEPKTITGGMLEDLGNNTWLVRSNIFLQDGSRLNLHGQTVRLRSNNDGSGHVFLRADWGTIDINNATVTSWDEAVAGPDTNYANGRAFIHVRSREGKGESRMDIKHSTVGYLGYAGAEAYGLAWKVMGANIDPTVFGRVDVFGDINNSRIHHNYFGVYTFGLFGGHWHDNEIDNNVQYGFDPHDDSDELIIEDNHVHHNGNHGIICSKRCNGLVIQDNVSDDNGGNGIMLHRHTNDTLVTRNTTRGNSDSGIAIFDSHDNTIVDNDIESNGRGIRLSVGSSGNTITNNDITFNTSYGLYTYKGSDTPLGGGSGRPHDNTFTDNRVRFNGQNAAKLKQSDNNHYAENLFDSNGKSVMFDDGNFNTLIDNTISKNDFAGVEFRNGSHDNVVRNNIINNNGKYGVYGRSNSRNNTVVDNQIVNNNRYGIRLDSTSTFRILNNTVANNTKYGIYLTNNNTDTVIDSNTVQDNVWGIYIRSNSDRTSVIRNTIDDNGKYGVYVKEGSDNALITNNTISSHTYGIRVRDSLNATTSPNTFSSNETNVRLD